MLYFGPWPLPPYCCKDSVIFIVNGRSIFNQIFAYAGICGWPMQSAHLWHATGHNGPHPVSHEPPKTARQEQRPMRPGSGSAAQQGFEDGAASALGSGAAVRLSMPLRLSVGPRALRRAASRLLLFMASTFVHRYKPLGSLNPSTRPPSVAIADWYWLSGRPRPSFHLSAVAAAALALLASNGVPAALSHVCPPIAIVYGSMLHVACHQLSGTTTTSDGYANLSR